MLLSFNYSAWNVLILLVKRKYILTVILDNYTRSVEQNGYSLTG